MTEVEHLRSMADAVEPWCQNSDTHHEWCGCQIARKLRERADSLLRLANEMDRASLLIFKSDAIGVEHLQIKAGEWSAKLGVGWTGG
jgi:hypothetical protein